MRLDYVFRSYAISNCLASRSWWSVFYPRPLLSLSYSLSLSLSLSLSRSFVRVLAFSGHRSHVCNETLQIHRAVGLLGKYLNLHLATILFRWKIGWFEEAGFLISSSFHSNHGQEHQYLDTVETRLSKHVEAEPLLPKLRSTVIS